MTSQPLLISNLLVVYGRDPRVEIMTHGNLPGFPSLLGKQKRALVPLVAQVLDPEPADGPDPGAGVDERSQDRPVPKPVHDSYPS